MLSSNCKINTISTGWLTADGVVDPGITFEVFPKDCLEWMAYGAVAR
jgi:hypothetical protein